MEFVSAIAVGIAEPDRPVLEAVFRRNGWRLRRARDRREALIMLGCAPAEVIIGPTDLPHGGWRDLLEDLSTLSEPPALIVTSRHADSALCAEVLHLGGYDVLVTPLVPEEVTRVIAAAARSVEYQSFSAS